jgi:competence protein ComEA
MPVTVLLAVAVVAGGVVAWLRYEPGGPAEVYYPRLPERRGQVYIHGAVSNPGLYPFSGDDSISGLVRAAGGSDVNAGLTGIELYVSGDGEGSEPQRIDINRAEVWLLESLPGIGETLARRIVDYRLENGPYRGTSEITRVDGIGADTYEKIKDLITVSD